MSEDWKNNLIGLSFDISQERTGWALMKGVNVLKYGDISIHGHVGNNDSGFHLVLLNYYEKVSKIIEECNLDDGKIFHYVVLEDLNITYNRAAKTLMQFHAMVKLAIAQNLNVGLYTINNSTVKSYFKIKTRKSDIIQWKDIAKKEKVREVKIQIVDAINKLYYNKIKLSYQQNDEADAIAQWLCFIKKKVK